jgi:hypothetical protein
MKREELGERLAKLVAGYDKPTVNTRIIVTDPGLWKEIARAIVDAIDGRLAEAMTIDESVEADYIEEVEEPKRKTSRRGKK